VSDAAIQQWPSDVPCGSADPVSDFKAYFAKAPAGGPPASGVDLAIAGRSEICKKCAEAYAQAFGEDGPRRQWQDQLRRTFAVCLREIANGEGDFREFVMSIRDYYPGNDYEAELPLKVDDSKENITAAPQCWAIYSFINSTDFLYMPVAESAVGPASGNETNPMAEGRFNRNRVELDALNALRE
jgi:hypothetical protein